MHNKKTKIGIFILMLSLISIFPLFSIAIYWDWNEGEGPPIIPPLPIEKPEPTLLQSNTMSPSTDGLINLYWLESSGASEYRVYRNNILIKTTTTLSYLDTNTESGTYTYKVYAYNSAGESESSNSLTFIVEITQGLPPIDPPNAPILNEITPAIDEDGIIYLNWSEVEFVDVYRIYRSIDNITYNQIKEVSENSYTDIIAINGNYTYKVSAKNGYGESGKSNSQTVNILLTEEISSSETDYTWIIIIVALSASLGILVLIAVKSRSILSKHRK